MILIIMRYIIHLVQFYRYNTCIIHKCTYARRRTYTHIHAHSPGVILTCRGSSACSAATRARHSGHTEPDLWCVAIGAVVVSIAGGGGGPLLSFFFSSPSFICSNPLLYMKGLFNKAPPCFRCAVPGAQRTLQGQCFALGTPDHLVLRTARTVQFISCGVVKAMRVTGACYRSRTHGYIPFS